MTDDPPDADSEADENSEDCRPVASGMLRCLEMLADEATVLHLPRTLDALHRAMAICAVESAEIADDNGLLMALQRPADARLH